MAGDGLRLTADLRTAHFGRWTAVTIPQLCSDGNVNGCREKIKRGGFQNKIP